MFSDRFFFGKENREGGIQISPDTLYSEEQGYGFVTDSNIPKDENLRIPDLCNNYVLPSCYVDEKVMDIMQDEQGCYIDSAAVCRTLSAEEGRLIPLYFRVNVPRSGNYTVKLKAYGSGEVLVFGATRRLMFKGQLKNGENEISVVQNVCDIIPRGITTVRNRRSIDLTILGADVKLSELEISICSCPTLYICGDSTVTDQSAEMPYSPGTSYSGWGQMLPVHFPMKLAVSNHAHSGQTTDSFRSEGHYSIIQACIKPGDYIMFQFAHNDQKLDYLKAYEGYYERLKEYIKEARQYGAYPIIITPLARNTWKADGSGYNDLLEEYAEACFKLGTQMNVPIIDLHKFSMEEILRDGLESSKRFYFPKDYTHTNDYGAFKMAGYIADEIKNFKKASSNNPYARLAEMVTKNETSWTVDTIPVVPELPERYKKGENKEKSAQIILERPDDSLLRAEALDMVIKTAKFFPTNVFNDLYDDIVGHEWFAGAVQCAYQNGIIPEGMIENKLFRPEEPINLEDFMCFLMGAYMSRKGLPIEKKCSFDKDTKDYSIKYIRAAVSLGLLKDGANLASCIKRKNAFDLCNSLNL
ncbi:MAG: GDSL-type esterase/lipase family protein [Lachnospiraceae bacterium]|nr:GDSL-type esterase/lipase family protein [Lachnospiraceae bacterium]